MAESNFKGVVVRKAWGKELEVFNNGIVSCWYLKINRDQQTSLHMHEIKTTAMILLSGQALLQEGLQMSRPIRALEKTKFAPRFFHRHTAINGDCELLEIETPIDKGDLYRFKDAYGREGQPYESVENFEPLIESDPKFVGGEMRVAGAKLRAFEFISGKSFATWAKHRAGGNIIVVTRGSLRSRHGREVVQPGDANWTQNMPELLADLTPDDDMQAILISSTVTGGAI